MLRGALAASLLLFAAAGLSFAQELAIKPLPSPATVRLRGLSAVSDTVAWASGREGTVLRTIDGGSTWSVFQVPGAAGLDFRDVQGFNETVALVMGAGPGNASRVYRTSDAGRTWVLVLSNPDAEGFFDCMDFRGEEGRLLGDPIGGRFRVFASSDGGRSWRLSKGPKAAKNEAAFAASGTCLLRVHGGTAIVTGGSVARVHFMPDKLESKVDWRALTATGIPTAPSAGLFSISVREGFEAIAVGGDFKQESGSGVAFGAAISSEVVRFGQVGRDGFPYFARDGNDLKLSHVFLPDPWWSVAFAPFRFFEGDPSGYRSAIACQAGSHSYCIATGPGGTDLLPPSGVSATRQRGPDGSEGNKLTVDDFATASAWRRVSDEGYDSADISGRTVWFSGDQGRLGRAELPAPP